MTPFESYEVNDADFEEACKNAPHWAKKRCLKKMRKVCWRRARWDKNLGLVREPLPPSDVEEYVKRFAFTHRDAHEGGRDVQG